MFPNAYLTDRQRILSPQLANRQSDHLLQTLNFKASEQLYLGPEVFNPERPIISHQVLIVLSPS